MAVNYGIFYFDGINFSSATSVFSNPALTTLAADGYYAQNGIVRQQLNGCIIKRTIMPHHVELIVVLE